MYGKTLAGFICLLFASILSGGCGGGTDSAAPPPTPVPPTPVAKGGRTLEIQVSEPASNDFASAFNLAQSIGNEAVSLSIDWSAIDIGTDYSTVPPTPIYADNPATDLLLIANRCYPNSDTALSLMLRPITTLTRTVPPGFENAPWDDPAMIERFKAFLDHVFARIPDLDITALAIGSEVDLHFPDATARDQYLVFFKAVSDYARSAYARLYPDKAPLSVTVEATHKGLLNPATRDYYQQLHRFSDVVGISYYPLADGLVEDPRVVAGVFRDLLELYPDRNLHFFQLGYPSGYYSPQAYAEYAAGNVTPVINSSETLQAEFIRAVFSAWDTHASRIDSISFTWQHDKTAADVATTIANPAFGGLSDPPPDYVEFLRTLGLRTEQSTDKAAWAVLAEEAAARGWVHNGKTLLCD